jgi:hypothetical protein
VATETTHVEGRTDINQKDVRMKNVTEKVKESDAKEGQFICHVKQSTITDFVIDMKEKNTAIGEKLLVKVSSKQDVE